ncbi:MAG: proprotein convertase P-domain-containing protein, partial [Phycisphaerales bacterium]
MCKKLLFMTSFVFVLAMTGTASADQWEITVPDAGFDDHVLPNVGDWIYVGDAAYTGAWKNLFADEGAWIDYGYYAGDIDLPALSGNNKVYATYPATTEDYIYQILDETFIEGGTYTLSVWVGIAWSGYDDYWSLYFTSEDHANNLSETGGSAPVGSWEQVSLVYTATAADAGKKIGIKMKGAEYVTFEDVTLSYDGPPRPPVATNPTPADGARGVSAAPVISTFISDDVPKATQDLQPTMPTNTLGRTTSTLTVNDSVTIDDLNVELDITMPGNNADLNVFLTSPDGKQVKLFDDVGFQEHHFKNTILDDEASKSITGGSGPFTGIFKPEGRLSDFDGRDTAGTWQLKIEDDYRGGTGTLNAWRIVVQHSISTISWTPSSDTRVVSQDVYFSDNFDDV